MRYVVGDTWTPLPNVSNVTNRYLAGNGSVSANATDHFGSTYVESYLRNQSESLDQYARNLSEGIAKYDPPSRLRHRGALLAFFPRQERLPAVHEGDLEINGTEHEQPVRKRLHSGDWSVRRSYSTADALRALSAAEKPFEHLADMARDLYAVGMDQSLDSGTRATLRKVAMVLDAGATLDPKANTIQIVGLVSRIGADALEGIPLNGADAHALLMASQNAMALKRTDAISRAFKPHEKPVEAPANEVALSKAQHKTAGDKSPNMRGGEGEASPPLTEVADGEPKTSIVRPPQRDDTIRYAYTEYQGEEPIEDASRTADLGDVRAAPEPLTRSPRYTWVDGVPLMLRRAAHKATEWRMPSLEPYRVHFLPRPLESTFFKVHHRDYIRFEGHIYGVRELSPGNWWIVSRSEAHLPPIPLIREGYVWVRKKIEMKTKPPAEGALVDEDGFIRHNAQKYVHFRGKLLEVTRPFIGGESAIEAFAEIPNEPLSMPNDMGMFTLSDGARMLEGEHGYYRLIAEDSTKKFFIIHESGRVEVEYGRDSNEWSVVDNSRADTGSNVGRPGDEAGAPVMVLEEDVVRDVSKAHVRMQGAGEETGEPPGETDSQEPLGKPQAPLARPESFESDLSELSGHHYLRPSDSTTFSQTALGLDDFYFFRDRPILAKRVKNCLQWMSDLALTNSEPFDANGRPLPWVIGIRQIRKEIQHLFRRAPVGAEKVSLKSRPPVRFPPRPSILKKRIGA